MRSVLIAAFALSSWCASAFDGKYATGTGSGVTLEIAQQPGGKASIDLQAPGCLGQFEGRARISGDTMSISDGTGADSCQITVRRTASGIDVMQGRGCSMHHGARCQFAGNWRGRTRATPVAQARPAGTAEPSEVRKLRDQAASLCTSRGGRVQFGAGFLTEANITPDGVTDYIVSYGGVSCNGAEFSGCSRDGMCSTYIVASSARQHVNVWTGSSRTLALESGNGADNVLIDGRRFGWNGRAFVMGGRPGQVASAPDTWAQAERGGGASGPPYGVWAVPNQPNGSCPDGGDGFSIENGAIKVNSGPDQQTYRNVRLERCQGDVCTFRQTGSSRTWSTRWLGPNRIAMRGPDGSGSVVRVEAFRENVAARCSVVRPLGG
jgi:hypothetical protein